MCIKFVGDRVSRPTAWEIPHAVSDEFQSIAAAARSGKTLETLAVSQSP